MTPSTVHLPNGQTIAVLPVFGGFSFKSNSLNVHHTAFPPGWTIVLQTEDDEGDGRPVSWTEQVGSLPAGCRDSFPSKKPNIHGFKRPTRADDYLFISSISNPSSSDFKPATSPTRQIAMMLWATLYWYFQQPEPDLRLTTDASAKTADAGKPRGDWRIYLRREGVFRGKNLLQKLERMGLISSEDSSVGLGVDERAGEGWQEMFISRRTFWQLDPRIFLFTLCPTQSSPFVSGSPYPSRPASPSNSHAGATAAASSSSRPESTADATVLATSQGLWAPSTPGPFASTSHLPTYFPPPPLQYIVTNDVRHPIRPKPPRQGETFYTRFIPSLGQYLSFRIASVSSKPPAHLGPSSPIYPSFLPPHSSLLEPPPPTVSPSSGAGPSDVDLLHKWMNDPRVAQFWGEDGPAAQQEMFLRNGLQSRHSFPVIGCWDGKPFGYMEIYWVREDRLGRYIEGSSGAWDRGIHCLVGEQEFRGAHRFRAWMSALVHYCFLADYRTERILLEPRVDNHKFINHLLELGFCQEKEVALPHKQAALMRITRENWEGPVL